MTLATRAGAIEPGPGRSPWDGHEYGRGYGVLSLPFDTGHLLGLRVFPENDFAPYASVWHRPPGGEWVIHVDGPDLDGACPRYWGPATGEVGYASIGVDWTGPADLRVTMEAPSLEWSLSMDAPPLLRVMNVVESAAPRFTWRSSHLRRFREWVARRYLGYGEIDLAFTTASGHEAVLVARRTYRVASSTAVLEGEPLGEPVALEQNPRIGDVPLPRTPSFVLGEAYTRIRDPEEYRRTRARIRQG